MALTRLGFDLAVVGETLVIAGVEPGLEAARAGLQPGDRIHSLAGQEIHDFDSYDRAIQTRPEGASLDLEIERRGQIERISVLPGGSFPWAVYLACATAAIFYLLLGLLALFSPIRSLRARLLAYLCAAVAIEMSLPATIPGGFYPNALLSVLFALLTGLQLSLELHLVTLIPERHRWVKRWPGIVPVFYLIGASLPTAAAATEILPLLGWDKLPWDREQLGWWTDAVVLPLWALALVTVLVSQIAYLGPSKSRHQAGLVLAGVLPWAILVWWLLGLELFGVSIPSWSGFGLPLTAACLPLAYFLAMFRYQLFENDLVVRRQLVYGLMTANLILLGYLLMGLGGALLSRRLEGSDLSMWIVSMATLILGALFVPLRKLVQRTVEKRFFPSTISASPPPHRTGCKGRREQDCRRDVPDAGS